VEVSLQEYDPSVLHRKRNAQCTIPNLLFGIPCNAMLARREPIRWAVGTKLPTGCLLIKSFIQYLTSLVAGVRGASKRSRHYIQMKLEL